MLTIVGLCVFHLFHKVYMILCYSESVNVLIFTHLHQNSHNLLLFQFYVIVFCFFVFLLGHNLVSLTIINKILFKYVVHPTSKSCFIDVCLFPTLHRTAGNELRYFSLQKIENILNSAPYVIKSYQSTDEEQPYIKGR